MAKKMDIAELETKLAEARKELSVKIGSDMVEKKGFKSYSAYTTFMRKANAALKQAATVQRAPSETVPVSRSAEPLPSELKVQSLQFEEQLEKWMENNWGNKIDYKTFYPELLAFFQKLNRLE